MSELYSISQVAKQLNLNPHTLRYYERAGLLLAVQRTQGNARRYSLQAVELIKLLLKLRATGMSIAQMKTYTDLIPGGEKTVQERIEIFHTHRNSLDSQIEELQQCRDIVNAKLAVYEAGVSMEDTDHPAIKKLTALLNRKPQK
ncbi:MAG: MerR family transcriptional regulator [Fimbriimonadaceae bacterium]